MTRLETEVPQAWKDKLKEIGQKKGNTSIRQLLRDAVYNTYIKPKPSQPTSE